MLQSLPKKRGGWRFVCLKVALFVNLPHSHNKQSTNKIAGDHGFVLSWSCAHGGLIDSLRASMLLYSKDMIIAGWKTNLTRILYHSKLSYARVLTS
jgi:hypothetical protein